MKRFCLAFAIFSILAPLNVARAADTEGVKNAKWCLYEATKKIKDQPMTEDCLAAIALVPQHGVTHQNELASQAIQRAKDGKEDEAINLLAVCQCHNANARSSLYRDRADVLAWLKSQ